MQVGKLDKIMRWMSNSCRLSRCYCRSGTSCSRCLSFLQAEIKPRKHTLLDSELSQVLQHDFSSIANFWMAETPKDPGMLLQAEARKIAEQTQSLEDARARLTEELARRDATVQQKEAAAEQESQQKEALLARAASQLDQVQHEIGEEYVSTSRLHATVLHNCTVG